jgi:hypothetical protein
MFFLPNRLFVKQDKLFISFNLSVIPRDMDVTFMAIHLPLLSFSTTTKVYVKEITAGWSEKSMKKGSFPPRSNMLQLLKCSPGQDELIINVTDFRKKWRLKKKQNYGIHVRLKDKQIKYLEDNPPYLVIDTI